MEDPGDRLSDRTSRFLNEYVDNQGAPDGLVWHYTTEQWAIEILSSGAIWASSLRHMKDPREIIGGHRLIAARMQKRLDDTQLKTVADRVAGALLKYPVGAQQQDYTYSVSFSAREDDQWQWKRFGQGAGVALGSYLNDVTALNLPRFHVVPLRCIYGKKRQVDVVNRFLHWLEEGRAEGGTRATEVFLMANLLATGFKDEKFELENEWRLAVWVDSGNQVLTRKADGPEIPYVELLLRGSDGATSVEQVMMGPPKDRDSSQVQQAMSTAGLADDRLVRSSQGGDSTGLADRGEA